MDAEEVMGCSFDRRTIIEPGVHEFASGAEHSGAVVDHRPGLPSAGCEPNSTR